MQNNIYHFEHFFASGASLVYGQQNVVSITLLALAVLALAVLFSGWVIDLISGNISTQTSVRLQPSIFVDTVYYEGNKTCLLVRTGGEENVEVSSVTVYVWEKGTLSGAFPVIETTCGPNVEKGEVCSMCIQYLPSTDDGFVAVNDGPKQQLTPVPEPGQPFTLTCDSCASCTVALQNAAVWAERNNTTATVRATQDLVLPAGEVKCIALQNVDFGGRVTFDGYGATIIGPSATTPPTGTTGIDLNGVTGLKLYFFYVDGFDYAIKITNSAGIRISDAFLSGYSAGPSQGEGVVISSSSNITMEFLHVSLTERNNVTILNSFNISLPSMTLKDACSSSTDVNCAALRIVDSNTVSFPDAWITTILGNGIVIDSSATVTSSVLYVEGNTNAIAVYDSQDVNIYSLSATTYSQGTGLFVGNASTVYIDVSDANSTVCTNVLDVNVVPGATLSCVCGTGYLKYTTVTGTPSCACTAPC